MPRSQARMPRCNMDDSQCLALVEALDDYRARWPEEAGVVQLFVELLRASGSDVAADVFRRERLAGHLTGSAWLVDRSGERVLLTHHRKLDRWLQPGGHADGERDPMRVALREAEEETGLRGLRVVPGIFDLDRHRIPRHKDVPGHWHYDLRYLVRAGDDEDYVVSAESHALAWRPVAHVAEDPDSDASVRRMARKWLARRE